MSYEQLPKEIWKEISMAHYGTYNVLVRCSKEFQLEDDFIKSHFVIIKSKGYSTETRLPNGWLHSRYDEPASVFLNDCILYWFKNNTLHRGNDQPATIYSNGHREWRVNGKRHRNNRQPAVIYSNDAQEWWIHGIQCYKNGDPM